MDKIIYLDNNATTPLDRRVLDAMMPYLTELFANPSSNHSFGVKVNDAVKEARKQVADLIGAEANEIIFTSGATEAINLAIKGIAQQYSDKGKHIVTASTEHPAVLDTCKFLESIGYEVTYLSVDKYGLLNTNEVEQAIREDTILLSIMYVNNEIGVIQDIKEFARIAHRKGAFFMTDATQAVGKLPINVDDLGVDILAFSGHKFYGPKGIGGLFIRNRKPNKVKPLALLHGGGHEKGYRSGTLNVPGIIGIGKAAEIAKGEIDADRVSIQKLRDYLESSLLKIEDTFLNGHPTQRLYNVSNICFKGADADAIIIGLKNIAVSNGSACSSNKIEPSHVLTAMARIDLEAYSSIRFSLSKFNSLEEIDFLINQLQKVILSLRSMV
ncbi:cysteine desulfurase [Rhodocytophaga rosea]|uniref:cysteine desulfurase n=1 Tax=Rhodocytophaga rosea TaxID=2704465 RepID=A0A6C0GM46_9BACT|nr:cysteine desulfurase family protein [Rhodocytophaga rosea]QHT68710.1 cysteine desulfurase [Rhodocytophaga rosea]